MPRGSVRVPSPRLDTRAREHVAYAHHLADDLASPPEADALPIQTVEQGKVAVVLEAGYAGADGDRSIAALVERHPHAAVIGVDMPIGLPHEGARDCDTAARALIGKRRSSVFLAPPQGVLDAQSQHGFSCPDVHEHVQ